MTMVSEYPVPPVPSCGPDHHVVSKSFDSPGSLSVGWLGYWGALRTVTPQGTFLVFNRTISKQGPTYDLPSSVRDCLLLDTTYYLQRDQIRRVFHDVRFDRIKLFDAFFLPEGYVNQEDLERRQSPHELRQMELDPSQNNLFLN